MGEWHPDREAFAQFLDDRLSEVDSRSLQQHLFACPECEERLVDLLPLAEAARSSTPEGLESGYRTLLRDLLDSTRSEVDRRRALLSREHREAKELWRELRTLEPAERWDRVAADPRFHTWGLFELLLEKARHAALSEPRRAEEKLRLALELAGRLDGGRYGHGSVEAARTRAWAYLGNSLRILSDFRQAEQAFQMAELHFSRSWLDPLDEALLLELKGSLRRAQRRFAEAVGLFDDAIALYREVNEPHLQGRALMTKGVVLQYNGEFAAATSCFRNSLFLLDGTEEPRLVVATQFNLINCLFDSGNTGEAATLIPEARHLMEEAGTPSDLLHLRWLEAQVAAALGRTAEAEQAFLELKEAFSEARAAFDAALVALELAALYAQTGRAAEVKALAAEIIPIFQACDVPQEALAALIVLQKAAEMEHLTLGLVEEVSAFLGRAQSNPGLRFRCEAEREALDDTASRDLKGKDGPGRPARAGRAS
jgi:tetratricopeptide (TPR) repeat protein